MEGAGGVNAHQLTGDADLDLDTAGAEDNEKRSCCQPTEIQKFNFQAQFSATGKWHVGPKS